MVSHSRVRFPLMALAGLSLLTALWAGFARLGWILPWQDWGLPANHGPLMVAGFLGTLIGLERAIALKRPWTYGAPLLAGMGGLALLVGLPLHVGHILAAAGSLFLVTIFIFLFRQQPSLFLATMGLGALLWFAGNLLWHRGYPLYEVVPWWSGFLVLTIAGERLELSRFLRPSVWSSAGFVLASGLCLAGLLVGLFALHAGIRVSGVGLVALALWLLRRDIAWRSIRQPGLPRFMATCLLSGYLWLGAGGSLWFLFGNLFAPGPYYDAMVHSILVGFVFSMIFGHAPIIFPSVMDVAMPFQRAFYGHLALLHLSLSLRVGGDLAAWLPGRKWGGLLNVLAVLLFLANNVRAVALGKAHTRNREKMSEERRKLLGRK